MEVFDKPVVVIDNGSFRLKAGFACDNHPVAMFRTVVGRPNYLQGSYGKQPYDVSIGDEAMEKVLELELSNPVVKGRIVHWDNMERIWHHIFYRELKAAPEDRAVLLNVSADCDMNEKIKCCEIFFETLNAPALCIQPQAVMALYGVGYTTGICVDIGYDTTDINPVYEGGLIKYAHVRSGLAALQTTNFLKKWLMDRNFDFGVKTLDVIEGVIRTKLYITQNISMSRKNYERYYQLPDGNEIRVDQEAFLASEMYFSPVEVMAVLNEPSSFMSLQDAVITAGLKCDAELRSEMYEAVVVCGGLGMVPGISERLGAELEYKMHRPVGIQTSSEAYAISWLGGATFAGLEDSRKMWVHKKQWEDFGTKIVKNKFM